MVDPDDETVGWQVPAELEDAPDLSERHQAMIESLMTTAMSLLEDVMASNAELSERTAAIESARKCIGEASRISTSARRLKMWEADRLSKFTQDKKANLDDVFDLLSQRISEASKDPEKMAELLKGMENK